MGISIYFIGLLSVICGSFLSIFFNENLKLKVVAFFCTIGTLLCTIPALKVLVSAQTLSKSLLFSIPFGQIDFVIDPLSAFFIIITSFLSLLATIYANGYMKQYLNKNMNISSHCLFLGTLIASMLCVVTVQNALFFLVIWEIISLSSAFLIWFEDDKKEVLKSGLKYLIYMHISVIFIILTFVLLSVHSQSLNFSDFKTLLTNNQMLSNIIFLTGFIGFGAECGIIPFHNRLVDAHSATPSHVSAIISGAMIKTGIYGILRLYSLIGTLSPSIGYFVLIISVLSALYGTLCAISQHDLKRLLAYYSPINIGIIGIGIGVGILALSYNNTTVAILGFTGALLHVLNHCVSKGLLFFAEGSLRLKTHTSDIELLGGLIKPMPKTALLFLIGSVAICGLPPLNGFISEFLIYFGLLKGLSFNSPVALIVFILTILGLILVGTFTILCFSKVYSAMFLGTPRSECSSQVKDDACFCIIFPMSVLALASLSIGIFPKHVCNFMCAPVSVLLPSVTVPHIVELMQNIAIICFCLISIIILLALFKFITQNKVSKHSEWGWGYDKPNNKLQYTASSYASSLLSKITTLFKKVFVIKKPKTLFPSNKHFEHCIEDDKKAYLLKPFIKSAKKFIARFEKIQNGNIQQYILYGLIFLLLALIGVNLI